jgi:hyperosmotically inducible protein
MRFKAILAVFATALVALACGDSDTEVDLEEASQAVEEARVQVEQARETVEAREAEVQEAQQRLAEAKAALREAESEFAKREAVVNRSATDDVLFRAVQKRLLEDEKLAEVAIAARVSKGVVTLSGSVPDAELRDHAVEIARTTPGVSSVESLIEVPVPAGEEAAL